MRKLITFLLMSSCLLVNAQSNLTTSIIEVGRTLVDLVRVFRVPKTMLYPSARNSTVTVDSFYSNGLADISYKNTFGKNMQVSLFKRIRAIYSIISLNLYIGYNVQEYLYEVPIAIYKFKIEYENEDEKKLVYREG
jgi:hypothetical protein